MADIENRVGRVLRWMSFGPHLVADECGAIEPPDPPAVPQRHARKN